MTTEYFERRRATGNQCFLAAILYELFSGQLVGVAPYPLSMLMFLLALIPFFGLYLWALLLWKDEEGFRNA